MVIGFETEDLRLLCEDEAAANEAFGAAARLLLAALAELDSAPTLGELPPGIAEATHGHANRFSIETGELRLMFVASQRNLPLDANGALDACKVSRVKVIGIEHHG